MRIGTDCSLRVCREEGYTVMDFSPKLLFPRGRKGGIDKDCPVVFSASLPEYLDPDPKRGRAWEAEWTWHELITCYERHKKSVDETCDFEHCSPSFENPTEYDVLRLGDSIHAVVGLCY